MNLLLKQAIKEYKASKEYKALKSKRKTAEALQLKYRDRIAFISVETIAAICEAERLIDKYMLNEVEFTRGVNSDEHKIISSYNRL